MSQSPATPAGKQAINSEPSTTKSSMEKSTFTSKVKQASLNEPSPASTYGDTVGSSAPATPQDALVSGPMSCLAHSLLAAHLDPAIQSISASPMTGRGAKQHEGLLHLRSQVSLSPTEMEPHREIFQNLSTSSSPNSDRLKSIKGTPNWRQSAKQSDDVFTSNGREQYSPRGDVVYTPRHAGVVVSSSPRNDRTGVPLSKDTSQRYLLPENCVFVANLMSALQDDQLEHHVQDVFIQFGDCFTKIKRDKGGMPYAFVQYYNAEDAKQAVTQGRGQLVANRPCRTEVAKVHRSVYLSKITGGRISEAEAREIMSRFGALEEVWTCSQTEQAIFGLPEGIWVKFKYFDECRDAQTGLRDDAQFRLEQPIQAPPRSTPDTGRIQAASHSYQAGSPMQRSSPTAIMYSPERRGADGRSIFVGNLPSDAMREGIHQIFGVYGHILHIELVRKGFNNVFAFVEYMSPDSATFAVQAAQGAAYGDVFLRVELKESSNPPPRRGGSPRSNFMGGSPNAMGQMMFQQGVLAGMAQAGHQALPPPPVYHHPATPNWFAQGFNPSPFGQYPAPAAPITNNTAAVNQAHGNGYMAQPMGQFQSFAPSQFFHPHQQPAHQAYQQQPVAQPYQWPINNGDSDNTNADE